MALRTGEALLVEKQLAPTLDVAAVGHRERLVLVLRRRLGRVRCEERRQQNRAPCHSERSEESLVCRAKDERFFAALRMTGLSWIHWHLAYKSIAMTS